MILKQLEQQLLSYGYAKGFAMEPGVSIYRAQYEDDWYLVCVMRDTGRQLKNGGFDRIMEQEAELLYRQCSVHGARIYPLGLVISENVAESRSNCAGRFACWYIDEEQNRLVIYDDQPGRFLNLREIIELILQLRQEEAVQQNDEEGRKRVKAIRMTPVNMLLICANVMIYAILEWVGDTTDVGFMYQNGAMLIAEMNRTEAWYRLFTSAFLHFGFSHMFSNMLVLLYLGDNLEKVLGSGKYLLLYVASVIGSSALSCIWYWMHGEVMVVSAGASGAIFGVVGGLLYVVIRNRGKLEDISGFQLILLIVFTLYHGITSLAGGINNSAHIGGLLVGALVTMLLYRGKSAASPNDMNIDEAERINER